MVIGLANAPLLVVLNPGAELRGIGARTVGAAPATTSSGADAVPACPAMDFGAPEDPPAPRGRYPFAAAITGPVASFPSAMGAPDTLADASRL